MRMICRKSGSRFRDMLALSVLVAFELRLQGQQLGERRIRIGLLAAAAPRFGSRQLRDGRLSSPRSRSLKSRRAFAARAAIAARSRSGRSRAAALALGGGRPSPRLRAGLALRLAPAALPRRVRSPLTRGGGAADGRDARWRSPSAGVASACGGLPSAAAAAAPRRQAGGRALRPARSRRRLRGCAVRLRGGRRSLGRTAGPPHLDHLGLGGRRSGCFGRSGAICVGAAASAAGACGAASADAAGSAATGGIDRRARLQRLRQARRRRLGVGRERRRVFSGHRLRVGSTAGVSARRGCRLGAPATSAGAAAGVAAGSADCRRRFRLRRFRPLLHAIAERAQDRGEVLARRAGERRHRAGHGEAAAVERAGRLRAGRRRRARPAPAGSDRRAAPEYRRAPRARRRPDSRRCDRAPSACPCRPGSRCGRCDASCCTSSRPLVVRAVVLERPELRREARGAGFSSAGR